MALGFLANLGGFAQANQAYQTGEAQLQGIQESVKERQQNRQINDLNMQAMQQQQQRQKQEQEQMQQLASARKQQEAVIQQQKKDEITKYQSDTFGVNPDIKSQLDYLQSQEDVARANLDFGGADSIRKQIDTARKDNDSAIAAAEKDKTATQDRMANVLLDAKDPQRMAAAINTIGEEAFSTGNPYYKNLYERLAKTNIADPMAINQVQQMGKMLADTATKNNLAKAAKDEADIKREEMRDTRMEKTAQMNAESRQEITNLRLDEIRKSREEREATYRNKIKQIAKLTEPKEVERTSSKLKLDYPKMDRATLDKMAEDVRTKQKEYMKADASLSAQDAYDQAYEEVKANVHPEGGTYIPSIGKVGEKQVYGKGAAKEKADYTPEESKVLSKFGL